MSRGTGFRWPLRSLVLLLAACRSVVPDAPTRQAPLALVPIPANIESCPGRFDLQATTVVVAGRGGDGVAAYFRDLMERTRAVHLAAAAAATDSAASPAIGFALNDDGGANDWRDESYHLDVTPNRITVTANKPHGLFNGAVTLWQLLENGSDNTLHAPCVHITDRPRFAWRGLLLDSARHFQSVEFVKRFIDTMALHKLNVMQWHLTDDQGWRIEIRKYPKLTQVGAWRAPQPNEMALVDPASGKYGGFYSQDQIRDIVRYAAERYVTIVPEIDMPGHAQAAVAAYPEIGVTGQSPPVSSDWGVNTFLFNVDESTFTFIDNVLSEVVALFPSPYIHVGGDEAAKDQWQASAHVQERMRRLGIRDEKDLQGYFTARLSGFLRAHGRTLVGWDEILEGGLPAGAVVTSWRGTAGAVAAAAHGNDVILSPDPGLYLDHLQSSAPTEPPGRVKVLSLADVYAFEPLPHELDSAQARHVIGAQANLWSEYLTTPERVERAAFPRAAALAEVLWSPAPARNWSGFVERLPAQFDRYRALGIAYADVALAPLPQITRGSSNSARVDIKRQVELGSVRYTIDGTPPRPASSEFAAAISVPMPATFQASTFLGTRQLATVSRRIDEAAVARRHSDALKPCGDSVLLRLEGGADAGGVAPLYNVDLMNPCWIYPQIDLAATQRVDVRIGALPYFFQLWHDTDKVVTYAPTGQADELQLRIDGCTGAPVATVALGDSSAPQVVSAVLAAGTGLHDLCAVFATRQRNRLWLVDWIEPIAR